LRYGAVVRDLAPEVEIVSGIDAVRDADNGKIRHGSLVPIS
jgi:hypothetical protein